MENRYGFIIEHFSEIEINLLDSYCLTCMEPIFKTDMFNIDILLIICYSNINTQYIMGSRALLNLLDEDQIIKDITFLNLIDFISKL